MSKEDERARLLKISDQLDRMNNPCQQCGKRAAIGSKVHFASNFGLGFRRAENHLSGDFCPICIHKNYVNFMLVNFVGWFGIVSAVKVCQFLLSNTAQYERAVRVILRRRKQSIARVDEVLSKMAGPN